MERRLVDRAVDSCLSVAVLAIFYAVLLFMNHVEAENEKTLLTMPQSVGKEVVEFGMRWLMLMMKYGMLYALIAALTEMVTKNLTEKFVVNWGMSGFCLYVPINAYLANSILGNSTYSDYWMAGIAIVAAIIIIKMFQKTQKPE